MKAIQAMGAAWCVVILLVVWEMHLVPALAQQLEEAVIRGPLPRTTDGSVDLSKLRQTVADQFGRGVRAVQFTEFTLQSDEAKRLFLNPDQAKNILIRVADVIPLSTRAERKVTFTGLAANQEFRVALQRDDGQLRLRLDGNILSQLSSSEREQLIQNLKSQTGFDRVLLDATNNRGPKGDNSGRGSMNSGPGSINSGRSTGNDGRGKGGDRVVDSVRRLERAERVERPQRSERSERLERISR